MSVLDELGVYLDAQGVIERDGANRNLYEGELPESFAGTEPDPVMALTQYGSWQKPEHSLGGEATNLEFPSVQMLVRGSNFTTSLALITAGYNALVKIGGRETLSSVAYLAIEANDMPHQLARDKNERWRWVCNFNITKAPS